MTIHHKKTFVVSLLIFVLGIYAGACGADILEIQDPIPEYTSYVYAERDGYVKIEFRYSVYIDSEGTRCVINQDDIGMDIELNFFGAPIDGFYYRYYVVYNNGSILESEQQYMPYGENRTIMEFSEVYLSIKQNLTRYVESPEQKEIESFSGGFFLILGWTMVLVGGLGIGTSTDEFAYEPRRGKW